MTTLPTALAEEIAEVEWHWVKPHLQRDAVIVVAPEVGLAVAGGRIAANDTAAVAAWIDQGLIAKPSAGQLEAWEQEATRCFRTLIVQPYVLLEAAPEPQTEHGDRHVPG